MHSAFKVVAVITALTAGFYGPQALDKIQESLGSDMENIDLADYCMLSADTCKQESISMSLDKNTAQPLIPSTIRVTWPNAKQDTLLLSLKGLEMEMGTALYQLQSVGGDEYEGEIILPVCTLEKMTWVGELTDGTTTIHPAIRMAR
ncbi:hypothetical protein [Vibrio sp. 99-70-13A1]|uniref:hypothetical protein n=1 Tax=Vibrio sp. 99-70-13A1 TaxID=2607601 RepID=UPI0014934C54|nr:hypothetical protein [Vibrio sp. 99-70-13A1]NOH97176.1 hypothetical protein [Vibrio sp. 99-70-13A1]